MNTDTTIWLSSYFDPYAAWSRPFRQQWLAEAKYIEQ
jgi:hypothetical protein